jgi:ribA/ribD-fused uncharacterized protein
MTERFTFFWHGPFSQWHRSPFERNGVAYVTAEQYMMAGKARLFEDPEALAAILATESPREQKALGRRVRNFDGAVWDAHARDIVYDGNEAKFAADPALLNTLFATAGTTIVEASPVDRIWGIGLSADNPAAADRRTWRGRNWLGETLTRLRDDLMRKRDM